MRESRTEQKKSEIKNADIKSENTSSLLSNTILFKQYYFTGRNSREDGSFSLSKSIGRLCVFGVFQGF